MLDEVHEKGNGLTRESRVWPARTHRGPPSHTAHVCMCTRMTSSPDNSGPAKSSPFRMGKKVGVWSWWEGERKPQGSCLTLGETQMMKGECRACVHLLVLFILSL